MAKAAVAKVTRLNRRTMLDEANEQIESIDQREIPDGFIEVPTGAPLAQPGDSIKGVYKGPGQPKKIKKNKKPVNTYIIETESGAPVEILGAAQIDTFIGRVKIGDRVWIMRGKQVNGGKGRVNTYRFGIAKK